MTPEINKRKWDGWNELTTTNEWIKMREKKVKRAMIDECSVYCLFQKSAEKKTTEKRFNCLYTSFYKIGCVRNKTILACVCVVYASYTVLFFFLSVDVFNVSISYHRLTNLYLWLVAYSQILRFLCMLCVENCVPAWGKKIHNKMDLIVNFFFRFVLPLSLKRDFTIKM